MKYIIKTMGCLLASLLLLTACNDDDDNKDKTEMLNVEVSEFIRTNDWHNPDGAFQYLIVSGTTGSEVDYIGVGSIDGFNYELGHRYVLSIQRTTLTNPPADGGLYTYKLLSIISDEDLSTSEDKDVSYTPMSEQELRWKDNCPQELYKLTPSQLTLSSDGLLNNWPYESSVGIYVSQNQESSNSYYQHISYMPFKAYIVAVAKNRPNEEGEFYSCFREVPRGNNGFSEASIIPTADYEELMNNKTPAGTEYIYSVVLANAASLAIQEVYLKVTKADLP